MANRAPRQQQPAAENNDMARLADILQNAIGGRNQQQQLFKAPKYDGTSDVELFIQQYTDVAQANQWDAQAAHLNLRLSLEKSAVECTRGANVEAIFGNLRARFGLSMRQARDKLAMIRKEPGQNFHAFGVEILKLVRLAYPDMDAIVQEEFAVETVKRCIENRNLYRYLLPLQLNAVGNLCRAADEYVQAGAHTMPYRTRPNINALEAGEVDQTSDTEECEVNAVNTHVQRRNSAKNTDVKNDKQSEILGKLLSIMERNTQAVEALVKQGEQRPNKSSKGYSSTSKRACFACGSEDHLARDCPTKKSENSAGSQ